MIAIPVLCKDCKHFAFDVAYEGWHPCLLHSELSGVQAHMLNRAHDPYYPGIKAKADTLSCAVDDGVSLLVRPDFGCVSGEERLE